MYNDVKGKSREQGHITKKCVAKHTNYFLNFKMTLYSTTLVMKLLESCFKLKLLL